MKQLIIYRLSELTKNKTPEGYKRVNNSIIPVDWCVETLGDIVEYKKGFAFKSTDYCDKGVRIIRISDTTYNSIKDDSPVYIDRDCKDNNSEYELVQGDLIVSSVGSRPPLYDSMVGKVIRVPSTIQGALLNQNAIRLRAKVGYYQDYIYNNLKTKKYLTHIETSVRGNANQVSITLEDLFRFEIKIPSIAEQKVISEILLTWDQAIELKENLIEEKQRQKSGLMQKLLTGKVRLPGFDGELNYTSIDSHIKEIKLKNKSNKETRVLSVTNKLGFILQEEQFDRVVASKDLSNYKVVKNGQFAYNPSRVNVGSIDQLKNFDSGLLSPMYVVFECTEGLVSSYLYHFIKSDMFLNVIPNMLQGSVRDSLSFDSLKLIKLFVPSVCEQEAIAEILNKADIEIKLHEKELEALKQQKKGLMQLLLSGIVRANEETN